MLVCLSVCLSVCLFFCLFWVLRRFQHCTGHITTGSWKGRGNQYIEFARVVYCKLLTNGLFECVNDYPKLMPHLHGTFIMNRNFRKDLDNTLDTKNPKLQHFLFSGGLWICADYYGLAIQLFFFFWGGGGARLCSSQGCSPSTSKVPGLNLGPGSKCWKIGSYLPMPSCLQCGILTN